ncbi:Protein of unknown function [Jatrophihabitans endophyticus]|uniref:DUF4235 domain-containing protein n=1 Tax=Jatrophihabitans endophyticus TaxID=1206085 RepID=A0A1M5IXB6_9ACTN|nr:DUF4235 domain-containing protein [Jatrophihabitans endophyticus]SHG32911.1 Protein of unknown function [Jatrophihabitans endophyticus]
MLKVIYKPFGILASVLGGILAGQIFKQIWKLTAKEEDAPNATDYDSTWTEVLVSAAVQGAIFGGIKAMIDRAGATGFQRATGAWPGNTDPRDKKK